jgi:competence protein ComEC
MLHRSRIFADYILLYLTAVFIFTTVEIAVGSIYIIPVLILCVFFWRVKPVRYLAIFAATVVFAAVQVSNLSVPASNPVRGDFWGVVISEPKVSGAFQSVIIQSDETRIITKLPSYPKYQVGERVHIRGNPKPIAEDPYYQKNPGLYLVQRVKFVLPKAEVMEQDGVSDGNVFVKQWYELRRMLIGVREKYENVLLKALPKPYGGLSVGILLGNKDYLDVNMENIFVVVGIIHIMALSGYNITIIADSLGRAVQRRSVGLSLYLSFVGIWAFVLATGFSASVVRAAIMGSTILLARKLGRQADSFVAILLAAGIMVFINPYIIRYDLGFQLSFAAMTGIIFVAPRLKNYFKDLGKIFSEIVASTLGAQLFTFPLLGYYFGRLSYVSVIANMLVLPLIPLTMALIFLWGRLAFSQSGLVRR